jgi:hypothetical protein
MLFLDRAKTKKNKTKQKSSSFGKQNQKNKTKQNLQDSWPLTPAKVARLLLFLLFFVF